MYVPPAPFVSSRVPCWRVDWNDKQHAYAAAAAWSRPARARGLKHRSDGNYFWAVLGRSRTGAWVETAMPKAKQRSLMVAPARARGLKLFDLDANGATT